MEARIIKIAKHSMPLVSKATAMAQIVKATELQKRGIFKF